MPRVIITVPDKSAQPYRFQLDRKVVSLGRGSDNDIVIDSGSVSGKHAEMHRVEGGYELSDLGSTNGIKYKGMRERLIPLRSGMTVKIGDVAFDFSLTEEELEVIGLEKPMDETPVPELPEIDKPEKKERKSRPAPAQASLRKQEYAQPESGGGFGTVVLFLLLAGGAFYAGLSVRHNKETGGNLTSEILKKAETKKEVPPAAEPAPAE